MGKNQEMLLRDRRDAGRRLAAELASYAGRRPIILGLPRGGMPVAYEIANALGAPLDVLLVRKLGVPFQPELGMGAIGEGGIRVLNDELIARLGIPERDVEQVAVREHEELTRRAQAYRGDRPPLDARGRTVIVVDDGLATGFTARAAVEVLRRRGAGEVVLAVPVAAPQSLAELRPYVDALAFVHAPENFFGVGQWYDDFRQTTDDEVVELLRRGSGDDRPVDDDVEVNAAGVRLPGRLTVPPDARGIVVFAHGSDSSRHSTRNIQVARVLNDRRIATLLFDLLTPPEAADRTNVFDIPLLGERVAGAVRWTSARPDTARLPAGVFGASTGGGAALWAAAEPRSPIAAVVSRGGRPDLASDRLPDVRAPALLIVGERDREVLDLNERAARRLRCAWRLVVVPGATHLFEERGALEAVAKAAADWFSEHLNAARLAS